MKIKDTRKPQYLKLLMINIALAILTGSLMAYNEAKNNVPEEYGIESVFVK